MSIINQANNKAVGITPKISIGMPVFNGEKFINDAIRSILDQSFTDFELIISDNASTDGTGKICSKYAKRDSRIKYMRQQKNFGIAANWQYVLDHAVGEYFMWSPADDCWSTDWLKELSEQLSNTCNAVAIGKIYYIDESGNLIQPNVKRGGFLTDFPNLDKCKISVNRIIKFIANRNDMLIFGLFRTNHIKLIRLEQGIFSDSPIDGSYPIIYFILSFGGISISEKCMIYKRIHENQESDIPIQKVFDQFRTFLNHVYLSFIYLRKSSLNIIELCFICVFLFIFLNAALVRYRLNNIKNIFKSL